MTALAPLVPALDDSDIEVLDSGVRLLACGLRRDAIRAPMALGLRALAYMRWACWKPGLVIADRRARRDCAGYLYFLTGAGVAAAWRPMPEGAEAVKPVGRGGFVVLPAFLPLGRRLHAGSGREPLVWLVGEGPHDPALADPLELRDALRGAAWRLRRAKADPDEQRRMDDEEGLAMLTALADLVPPLPWLTG